MIRRFITALLSNGWFQVRHAVELHHDADVGMGELCPKPDL
jgi:hypothetical protein